MWEISSGSQAVTAILSVALGVFICLVYDLLRAARDYKRPGRVLVFLADVLFFVFCGIAVFSFLQLFSNGQPRLYILASVFAGFIFCRITVSYYVVKVVKNILRLTGKMTAVFGRGFYKFFSFFEKILKDSIKIVKKGLKRLKIPQKTLEK